MKSSLARGVGIFLSGVSLWAVSGCGTGPSSGSDPKPGKVGGGVGTKQPNLSNPVVVKAVPTASPSAKSKAKVRITRNPRAKSVPYGTPTDFTVDIESWPAGVTSVVLTAKCYQITNFYQSGTGGFAVVNPSPALTVFDGGTTTSKAVTVTTTSGPQTISVTPDASMGGWQILLGFCGSAADGAKFGGGEIFVVNQ